MMSLKNLLQARRIVGSTCGRTGGGEAVLPVEASFPGRQPGAKPSWQDGPQREEERGTSSDRSAIWNTENCPDPQAIGSRSPLIGRPAWSLTRDSPNSAQPLSTNWQVDLNRGLKGRWRGWGDLELQTEPQTVSLRGPSLPREEARKTSQPDLGKSLFLPIR